MKKLLSLILTLSLITICCAGCVNQTPQSITYNNQYYEQYKDFDNGTTLSLDPNNKTFKLNIQGAPGTEKTGRYQEDGNRVVLEMNDFNYEQHIFQKEGTSLKYDALNSHGMAMSGLDYTRLYKQQ